MRISAGILTIIDQAAKEKRCFYGSTHSQRRAMLNLARDGELKRTYCNTYMTAHQWDELVPPDRIRALHYDYADARSENGGEFECRAVIIEAGFMVPELQVEFNIDGRIKRVDFVHQMAPVPPTCGRHTAGGVGSEA